MRKTRAGIVAALTLSLTACGWLFVGKAGPMAVWSIAAPEASDEAPLVIVLPGAADDLTRLRRSGIVEAVQGAWPRADVVLVGATLAIYKEGRFVQRLHDEVVQAAVDRGYHDIYLAGASLGGMGAVLYEREHPGELSGVVLLAPFMGDEDLVKEIEDKGGVKDWEAGPLPPEVDGTNFQRELWRTVHRWGAQPEMALRVWLACGKDDALLRPAKLIGHVLPPGHFLQPDGGHLWTVWNPAAEEIFRRIRHAKKKGD